MVTEVNIRTLITKISTFLKGKKFTFIRTKYDHNLGKLDTNVLTSCELATEEYVDNSLDHVPPNGVGALKEVYPSQALVVYIKSKYMASEEKQALSLNVSVQFPKLKGFQHQCDSEKNQLIFEYEYDGSPVKIIFAIQK